MRLRTRKRIAVARQQRIYPFSKLYSSANLGSSTKDTAPPTVICRCSELLLPTLPKRSSCSPCRGRELIVADRSPGPPRRRRRRRRTRPFLALLLPLFLPSLLPISLPSLPALNRVPRVPRSNNNLIYYLSALRLLGLSGYRLARFFADASPLRLCRLLFAEPRLGLRLGLGPV
ncbi:hypothetical protein FN846DRAFT_924492, partial [Sphaerosporella brunnea]